MKLKSIGFSNAQIRRMVFILATCLLPFFNGLGQTALVKEGSIIIDMGVSPQTEANALKPYGLVYSLIRNLYTPVIWAINPSKAKDGVDLTFDGQDFKGGPFIVRKEYLTLAVQDTIAAWVAQGVVTYTTQSSQVISYYRELEFFAQWALDEQNGAIAIPYLQAAGIPTDAYAFVDPDDLGICNDLYIMPHADPTWNYAADDGDKNKGDIKHGHLVDWNAPESEGGFNGWIWAGCHAVSVLEGLFDPANTSKRANFLSLDPSSPPTQPTGDDVYNDELLEWGLINYKRHDDASGTTAGYQSAYPADPFMQFMGFAYGAHAGGSEQIYMPYNSGGWRPTTRIGAWDPNQADLTANGGTSPGESAMIAYGHAFGDPNRGQVMYEGGHRLDNGTAEENIAAQRAFFNFSFDAPQNKVPTFVDNSVNVPVVLAEGAQVSFAVDAEAYPGLLMDTIIWVSNTDGTFVTSQSGTGVSFIDGTATFTAPNNISEDISAIITAVSQDDCGRVSIIKWLITILANPAPPVAVDDNYTTYQDQSLTFNALTNDTDPNNDIDPSTITTTSSLTSAGNWEFIDNGNGNFTFVPDPTFTGVATLTYTVDDATGRPSNPAATITITVDPAPITCSGDFKSIAFGDPTTIYATSSAGSAKDADNAEGNTPGTRAEIDEDEDLRLGLSQNAPANYDFTMYWQNIDGGSTVNLKLLDASLVEVHNFGTITTTANGSNTLTAPVEWRYLFFEQSANAKAKLEYIEAVEVNIACIDDRDGDLIADDIDLDDDNDGILDSVEGEPTPCSQNETIVGVTSGITTVNDITTLYDGNLNQQNFYFGNNQDYPGSESEILNIQFADTLEITEIRILLDLAGGLSFMDDGVLYKIQGSNDNSNWTDIIGQTASVFTAAEQTAEEEIFDLSSNTNSYVYYRILWVGSNNSAQIVWDPWVEEILFTATACTSTGATDTDGDGIPDYWDLDSDNDGITDNIEAQSTAGYIQPSGVFDSNGVDEAYNGGLTAVDTDGDTTPDYIDTDSDNEGADDNTEARVAPNALGVPGTIQPNGLGINYGGSSSYADVNGPDYDNTPAGEFEDTDGDFGSGGDVDWRDNIVGADTDGDGVLDDVDIDDDNDGILDIVEGDTDSDGDGIVNRLDLDSDGDGIPDNIEAQTTVNYIPPGVYADTDGDGLNDIYDASEGGTTLVPVDTDGDGTVDYLDLNSDNKTGDDTLEGGIVLAGSVGANGLDTNLSDGTYNDVNGNFGDDQTTNWPDEDGDVLLGGDVDWRDATTGVDFDGDGILDPADIDDDNDGVLDVDEYDSNNIADPLLDTDIDGTFNYQDPDNPGWTDSNNDGIDDQYDTDLDGIIDQYDLDSDNDGIPDIVEAGGTDSDGNGVVDGTFTDVDNDGWSNVFDNDGESGTIHTDPDSDFDGIKDRVDLDSDNDGIPDIVEAQSTLGYVGISGNDSDGDGIDNAFDPDSGGTLSSSPVNTDGTDNPDYIDTDSDNDAVFDINESGTGLTADVNGRTTGTVGSNGLDNTLEAADTYSDPNGSKDDTQSDNYTDTDNDTQFGGDLDYRDSELNTPGGVSSCLSLWLRADKGGTSWTSFSGNNLTITQSGNVSAGSLLNFNAANDFTGGYYNTGLNINESALAGATVIAVYVPDEQDAGAVWGENDGSFDRYLSNADVTNGTGEQSDVTDLYRVNTPSLATVVFNEGVNNGSFVYVDGKLNLTFTANHGDESSNSMQVGAIGDNSSPFNGRIAEIMVFCETVTGTPLQKVQSYLALKYGITLDNTTPGDGDYLDSEGTVLWNSSTNATYHNNVAGIYRDDKSIIEQKQSKSSNSDAIVTVGLDDTNSADGLEASNVLNDGTFSANRAAMVWGHDNADINGGPGSVAETEYDPNQVNARLNREWKVQETGGDLGDLTIEFDVSGLLGPDNNVGTSDESQIVLLVDADGDFTSGASIVTQSFTVNDDGKVVFRANLSNGEFFTLGSSEQGALPITMVSFNGSATSRGIELNWTTSSEENNSHMIIERSSDGKTFSSIGTVQGQGTSVEMNRYDFLDLNPFDGKNYYRIIDVDILGNKHSSELVSIDYNYPEAVEKIYPNPVRRGESFTIQLSDSRTEVDYTIVDARGVNIVSSSTNSSQRRIVVSTSSLQPGIYMILVTANGRVSKYKVWVR